LSDWLKTNPSQETRNRIGQALWDFYDYQIHTLKMVHADPHPGNFIITEDEKLGIIDFGCVKVIPEDFYAEYFKLLKPGITQDKDYFIDLLDTLGFFLPNDTEQERNFFIKTFTRVAELLGKPFASSNFDFSDKEYFAEVYGLGDEISTDKQFRKSNAARGSQHGIYINRTYFGLYHILHLLEARVNSKFNFKDELFGKDS
ncbi:MAG: phosphotransferase, partial [Bacteroidetes bacterium]|nr:phosphotransferase [Bacteroidota bacterium]